MSEPIHEIDPATGLSRGIYAIDPSGHLITLGRTQSIRAGFRYATQGEIDGTSVAPAPQPEPEPVRIEIHDNYSDLITPSDSDQD